MKWRRRNPGVSRVRNRDEVVQIHPVKVNAIRKTTNEDEEEEESEDGDEFDEDDDEERQKGI